VSGWASGVRRATPDVINHSADDRLFTGNDYASRDNHRNSDVVYRSEAAPPLRYASAKRSKDGHDWFSLIN